MPAGHGMADLKGRKAIVTGASSGIGRATSLALARNGCDLVVAARREARLEELAAECRALGVNCRVQPTDVSLGGECEALIRAAEQHMGGVDILVNVAGFGTLGPVAESDPATAESMIQTNYLGTVRCCRAVLPGMIARGSGSIINVASITGLMGFAGMSTYGATKAAVILFSEALRSEVIGQGVRVSVVCPGTTRTEFFDHADPAAMPAAERLLPTMTAERVARAVLRSIHRGNRRTIIPGLAAVFIRFKEWFPATAYRLFRAVSSMMRRFQ